MTTYPKKLNGLCVGVLSGDRVLFQGPPDKENGGHKQKILHLTAITAPKVDTANGKDEKFGYASRQFLRTRLVGKQLPFVVERKAGEIQLGYVLYEGKDVSIDLLAEGLAKLRSDKINCDHIEDYKNAEVDAQMGERALWSLETKPKGADRYLKLDWTDQDILASFKGKKLRGIVQQIHPSKAVIYIQQIGWMGTINFSEVQVVVLSDKQQGEKKTSNVRAIRSTLQSAFLNRQVNIFLTGLGEAGLTGYFTLGDEDVRKVLLRNGFAKLGKDAMTGISTQQFMELKMIAQQALQESKGLWKQQKVIKGETLNSKSYMATVTEIHSGDSLTVCNEKQQFQRVFLPNVRAPAAGQPFSFQAKQALRRRVVGNRVRVEIQFSKKITVKKAEGDKGELKDFIYASIFQNQVNITAHLLEAGLLTIQTPRVEEDVTKYFDILREAEAKGKKERKGMYSNFDGKPPNFNDLSGGKGKKVDAARCKNLFPFLKDEKSLTGVIDLVLNGSRFKMRFNQQHVMAIMVLEGVRCLPNEGPFSRASEEALVFSKLHASQRDVEIELKSVDLKGIFHGKVLINKKDYALQLLERGLAICMGGRSRNPRYEDAENIARKNKIGLWGYNLNLSSIKGEIEKEYKAVNFSKTLTLLQVANANEFYLEPDNAKRPNVPQNPKPAASVEVGTLVAGRFTADDTYYRAKVLREAGGNKYHVLYIDYGNNEVITKDRIGVLPEELKGVKSPLFRCSLYGVDSLTGEGLSVLKDFIDAKLKVDFKEELVPAGKQEVDYRVILTEKGDSINLQLLQFGEAQCNCDDPQWRKAEQKARQMREGKWAADDA